MPVLSKRSTRNACLTLFWEGTIAWARAKQSPAQRRTISTSYPNTRAFRKRRVGDTFAALPDHILITHVLSSANLPDPGDLARLSRSVSSELRDAVAATGCEVYELEAQQDIDFGDLSGMQLLHQRGDLDGDFDDLCWLAAQSGQLEILKRTRMAVRGTGRRASTRRIEDAWKCFSGCARAAASVTRRRV